MLKAHQSALSLLRRDNIAEVGGAQTKRYDGLDESTIQVQVSMHDTSYKEIATMVV